MPRHTEIKAPTGRGICSARMEAALDELAVVIVVAFSAALLGAALAGPTEAFVSAIVVVSGILLYVAYEFWIGAAWRRLRDR